MKWNSTLYLFLPLSESRVFLQNLKGHSVKEQLPLICIENFLVIPIPPQNNLLGSSDTLGHILLTDAQNKATAA